MSEFTSPALRDLEASLNATNVLSEQFSGRILQLAMAAHADGHKLGRESVEKDALRARVEVIPSGNTWNKVLKDGVYIGGFHRKPTTFNGATFHYRGGKGAGRAATRQEAIDALLGV